MSFDLAVWYEPEPVIFRIAHEKSDRLWNWDRTSFVPNEGVAAFYDALIARFPRHDQLSEDEWESRVVWSYPPEKFDTALVLNISFRNADEVSRVVRELADRHGLLYYDPQGSFIIHPGRMMNAAVGKMCTQNGSLAYEPDAETIRTLLNSLSKRNWFAILERADDWYVQVGRWKDERLWSLEYREGHPDKHFRTELPALGGVTEVFEAFGRGDLAWRDRYQWTKLDFSDDPHEDPAM